jgi:hypothetical protein
VIALARDFDFFAPCVPASLSAILLAGLNATSAGDVRTFVLWLIFHLKVSPFSETGSLFRSDSTPEIRHGEVEYLVGPAVHYGLYHKESEALRHLEGYLWRHGDFLPIHHGVD